MAKESGDYTSNRQIPSDRCLLRKEGSGGVGGTVGGIATGSHRRRRRFANACDARRRRRRSDNDGGWFVYVNGHITNECSDRLITYCSIVLLLLSSLHSCVAKSNSVRLRN